ncbi:pentatricopeptide repeat-containing protein At5g65560-like isoform X2 [Aristolochia californica]|uniref:pentatricopeptide repeat-containing protein At5g65560-like isoform X2 n=1 Tax=Aristolochia californica TaxID=171875 RepID=UPI0035E2499A
MIARRNAFGGFLPLAGQLFHHCNEYNSGLLSADGPPFPEIILPDVEKIFSLFSSPADGTRNLDDLLKDFKNKLSSDLVLQVLMNYRHLGRRNTLEFFSWAGIQIDFKFDDIIVEYMADFLGRRKLFDDMKWLLKTVSSRKGRISCRTISICIRFLGRQGRIKEALCLFQEMESGFNCVPNNLVFNNMLYVLCKKETSFESIDIALMIFRKIDSPDSYSYSNLVVGLCKCRRFENALHVFNEMFRRDMTPTRTAVNNLIGGLCELSKKEGCVEGVRVKEHGRAVNILVPNVAPKYSIQPAIEILWAILHREVLPSTFVVTQLITELCRLRRIEDALALLKVVEGRKQGSLDECYTSVIKVLCEVQQISEACKWFSKMISLGMKPKLDVYNSIIGTLCEVGNVLEAERHFKIMGRKRCAPDNVTYTTLIHAYCGNQNYEAAYEMLMEMMGLGWIPPVQTYNLVDDLVKKQGRAELSEKLEKNMETQLLHKYCKTGDLDAAYEKLCSMLAKGFHPPIYTRDVFERAFRKAGKWNSVRDLLENNER